MNVRVRGAEGKAAYAACSFYGAQFLSYRLDTAGVLIGHAMLVPPEPGANYFMEHIPDGPWFIPAVELTNVFVRDKHRGTGIGKALVDRCIKYVDAHNLSVILRVIPYRDGSKALSLNKLVNWYETFGFSSYHIGDGATLMHRPPSLI